MQQEISGILQKLHREKLHDSLKRIPLHLNRTCETAHRETARFGHDNRIYTGQTIEHRRFTEACGYARFSTRGRGRTRPEYLVNKRRPIETKVPGIRVVTSTIIQRIDTINRALVVVFPLERIRFSFDQPSPARIALLMSH